jgi:hypothetical protein
VFRTAMSSSVARHQDHTLEIIMYVRHFPSFIILRTALVWIQGEAEMFPWSTHGLMILSGMYYGEVGASDWGWRSRVPSSHLFLFRLVRRRVSCCTSAQVTRLCNEFTNGDSIPTHAPTKTPGSSRRDTISILPPQFI